MTTQEKNEVIAKWMGEAIDTGRFGENWKRILDNAGTVTIPPYDKSWDWLMPVCIRLNFKYICTDIHKAHEQVVNEIKKRNLEMGSGI